MGIPVKPDPAAVSAIGGVVMGVEDVAAGSGVGSGVVVGEGDAGWSVAPGALTKGVALELSGVASAGSAPSSASPSSASIALFLFSFPGPLAVSPSTDRPRKAVYKPSRESSAAATPDPDKGAGGAAPVTSGPGTSGAGLAGSDAAFSSMVPLVSMVFFSALLHSLQRLGVLFVLGRGLPEVHRVAGASATRKKDNGSFTPLLPWL